MFNWLRARFGSAPRVLSMVANWLSNAVWLFDTKFLTLTQQAFQQNEVVYACLRLLSQSVPEAPLISYKMKNNNERSPLDYDHPLVKLIRRPNRLMTEYEFWELTTLHMGIVGRSTWWKERDFMGHTIGLWPMRPDRVGPIYSDTNDPATNVLWGWSYLCPDGSGQISIPADDVLFFNFPDPTGESGGMVEGYGPLQALARQVAADNEATKFVGALLANYAAPTVLDGL